MLYKAKPTEVEVVQYKTDNIEEVERFLGHKVFDLYEEHDPVDMTTKTHFSINTLYGKIRVDDQDYIVKNILGDYMVYSKYDFRKLYEKVK